MKKKTVFHPILGNLLFALLLSSCQQKNVNPAEFAEQMELTYKEYTSISYDVDYQIKFFSNKDTNQLSARVDLIQEPTDSIFGGHIWIKQDSLDKYYDTKHIYIIDHKEKSIVRYDKKDDWAINGNIAGDVIDIYYLKPQRLSKALGDTLNQIEISSISINNKQFIKWTTIYAEEEDFKDQYKNIWFNPKTKILQQMNFHASFQGEEQYNQWDLNNVTTNQINTKVLEDRLKQFLKNYLLEDYQPRTQEEEDPLIAGTPFPAMKAISYPDEKDFLLPDPSAKLTLVDFWYMDCFPCLKAIPHLNELYKQYKDKGLLIVGVNPFDNQEENLERLPNFLSRNPINYPFLFCEREKLIDYNIFAFPTLYFIDQNGKVVYSKIGFEEKMVPKLDSLIQGYL